MATDTDLLHMIEQRLRLMDEEKFQKVVDTINEAWDEFLIYQVTGLDTVPASVRKNFMQSLKTAFFSGFCNGAIHEARKEEQ